jgi:tetratricopeptide (TPR) repeat protein
MPLLVLPAQDAFKRVRLSDSRWPRTQEAQAERLMPLAQPRFWPSFHINRSELIFTIGSCFARNIEKQLITEGYRVAAADFEIPLDQKFRADPDALMNRYVIASIANELRWGFGHKPFKKANLVYLGEDKWFDPHLHPLVAPAPFEEVLGRRTAITRYMSKARNARVFIMTLGLAEAWFDTQSGLYLNAVPPTIARDTYPGRFEFHLLDYNQILQQLEYVHRLLTLYGHPDVRILVTVSPVAMNTTFTGRDVLVANTYSKAVQRAAVEAFVLGHENVDYFPSFESVWLSDRRRAWREDQAHASDEIVRLNVLRMIEAYKDPHESTDDLQASRAIEAFHLVQTAREAAGLDAPDEAIAAYRKAVEAAPKEALILLEFGRFLYEQRMPDEAAEMLAAATEHGSGPYGGFYYLAQVLYASKRLEEAAEAANKAREFQPTRPGVVDLSANIARRLGNLDEAIKFGKMHLQLEPDSVQSRERLQQLVDQKATDKAASKARIRAAKEAKRVRLALVESGETPPPVKRARA